MSVARSKGARLAVNQSRKHAQFDSEATDSVGRLWVMRECPSCKVWKENADYPPLPERLGTRGHVILCAPCTREGEWFAKFPLGRECVYLVAGGGLRKIGYTNHLASRMASLRTMSPVALMLEHAWEGDRANETALHRRFKKQRHHGEWFLLSEESVAELVKSAIPAVHKMTASTMRTGRKLLVRGSRG